MGDVGRASAVNFVNFFKQSHLQYIETGKDIRKLKALRRIEKFLKIHPEQEEYIRTEIKKIEREYHA